MMTATEMTAPEVQAPAVRAPLSEAEREELIVSRIEMAVHAAEKFRRDGNYQVDTDDLRSEALIALTEAGKDYDPMTANMPFGAYAYRKINWRLLDYVRQWFRLSRVDFVDNRQDRRSILSIDDMRLDDYVELKKPTSRQVPAQMEPCQYLIDNFLTARERTILDLRFQQGFNLLEISRMIGVTHIRCRQICSRSIKVLRRGMRLLDRHKGNTGQRFQDAMTAAIAEMDARSAATKAMRVAC